MVQLRFEQEHLESALILALSWLSYAGESARQFGDLYKDSILIRLKVSLETSWRSGWEFTKSIYLQSHLDSAWRPSWLCWDHAGVFLLVLFVPKSSALVQLGVCCGCL